MVNILDEYPDLTEVVTWPDSQLIPTKKGALENCALINSPHGIDIYGSSAYRVNLEWYNKLLNDELEDMPQDEIDAWEDGGMQVDMSFPFDDEEDE